VDFVQFDANEEGCWLWTGSTHRGYAQFSIKARSRPAYRVSYRTFVGRIPEGYDVDHICENKACVNPDHLEAVTHEVNCRRRSGWKLIDCKWYCKQGHAIDFEANPKQCERCWRLAKAASNDRRR
jgi:hypothetical protein